jgi:hypothetical protein
MGKYSYCNLLFVIIILLALTSCAPSRQTLQQMQETDDILKSEITINKLPITVKLSLDDRTRNSSITATPRGAAARRLTLQTGRQLVKGAGKAAGIIFHDVQQRDTGDYQALLKVRLVDFQFDYTYTLGSFPNDRIMYNMAMVVETTLMDKGGKVIYSKELSDQHSGWGDHSGFAGNDGGAVTAAKGNAALVALWVKHFANDITANRDVQLYAKSLAGSLQFAKSPAPEIVISTPMDNSSTDKSEIILSGYIQSETPIREHRISVNGRRLAETRSVAVIPKADGRIIINRKIKIPVGENVLTLTAMDQAGMTSQNVIMVTRLETALGAVAIGHATEIGERFAVVVGISRYLNSNKGIPELKRAAADAREFTDFLKSPKGGGFEEKNILLLTNEQATSSALRRALFSFLKKSIEEDLVVLFFSGHGASEPGSADNYYLLTYDADPDDLATTAIPTWDVNIAFQRNISARRVVVLVDACHAASVGINTGTRGAAGSNQVNKYLQEMARTGEGKAFFSATQIGQTSIEPRSAGIKTGLFTHYLLEGLSGAADEDGNYIVTLGEVIDYTTDLVIAASRGRQQPDIEGAFDRNMPLAVLK